MVWTLSEGSREHDEICSPDSFVYTFQSCYEDRRSVGPLVTNENQAPTPALARSSRYHFCRACVGVIMSIMSRGLISRFQILLEVSTHKYKSIINSLAATTLPCRGR